MPPSLHRMVARPGRLAPAAGRLLRLVQVQPALRDVLVARGHVLGRLGPLALCLERLPLELPNHLVLPQRGGGVAGRLGPIVPAAGELSSSSSAF